MSIIDNINLTTNGETLPEQTEEDSHLMLFILWGVILPLIALAGLVGNILTIIVLWRREMHSTTILYLRGLVITDTGILIGTVITLTPISCANYLHADALEYFRNYVYPVIHAPGYYVIMTLQQCNVWITVSVSMERYIAICHPFRAARLITRRRTICVLVGIVIISLIYNIPHLLASKASSCDEPVTVELSPETKTTVISSDIGTYDIHLSSTFSTPSSRLMTPQTTSFPPNCLKVDTTDFGKTDIYTTYRTIMYSIIIYVIPFLALLILNSFLIKELMTMQRRRSGTNIHDENEANLSLVLVLIVIVFIFCQTPGLISQFDIIDPKAFIYWLAISNVLFTTNSAVNFLIYTAFGRKFRRVLLRVFRHIFKKHRRPSQSSCRTTQYTNGEVDSFDHPTTACGSLRLSSCYRKDSDSFHASENIPLNIVKDTKTTAFNGVIQDVKQNNGTKRVIYKRAEEESERDSGGNCGTAETISLVGQDRTNVPLYTETDKNNWQSPDSLISRKNEENKPMHKTNSNNKLTTQLDSTKIKPSEGLIKKCDQVEFRHDGDSLSNGTKSGKNSH